MTLLDSSGGIVSLANDVLVDSNFARSSLLGGFLCHGRDLLYGLYLLFGTQLTPKQLSFFCFLHSFYLHFCYDCMSTAFYCI